jgi:16S rRNA G527 N7-methylase RsmG
MKLTGSDVFCDVGAGLGRPGMVAGIVFNVGRVYNIEVDPIKF